MAEQQLYRVLIADDDVDVISACLGITARSLNAKASIKYASSPQGTLSILCKETFDLIFLDISFGRGDMSGIGIIPEVVKNHPRSKLVMLSGLDDDRTVLQCVQLGATDFVSKNNEGLGKLANIIENNIASDITHHNDLADGEKIAEACGAIFSSEKMSLVFKQVALARRHPELPVLIIGETGVGKEVIARAINFDTKRPKVDVDCGAIPENLAESEFFGHKRGAFTGADNSKLGKFQLANNGDLFLDEIGNLKRGLQDKFLRALQYKEITPLGGITQKVSVRIIAATNESLDKLVEQGRFRQDLYERLKGIVIEIPTLRERPEDIEPLIRNFIRVSAKPELTVAPTCMNLLKSYSWRGNVRELELITKEMIAGSSGNQLNIAHLPKRFRMALASELAPTFEATDQQASAGYRVYNLPLNGSLDEVTDCFLAMYLFDRFKLLGEKASKTELAKELGIARNSLSQYLKRLSVALPEVGI